MLSTTVTHLRGHLRLLHPLTNPHVHMLGSSWKLIHPCQPVLELQQRENHNEQRSDRLD